MYFDQQDCEASIGLDAHVESAKICCGHLQGPQLMIVVPTKELGVQTVMLIYKLFGGSMNSGIPGDPTNMFSYSGPRGIKVSRLRTQPF